MQKSRPVRIKVYGPVTDEGRRELARRVAQVHGDAVVETIGRQRCPADRKLALLQAVLDRAGRGTP